MKGFEEAVKYINDVQNKSFLTSVRMVKLFIRMHVGTPKPD